MQQSIKRSTGLIVGVWKNNLLNLISKLTKFYTPMCQKHGGTRFVSIHYQIMISAKTRKPQKNTSISFDTETESISSDEGLKNKD